MLNDLVDQAVSERLVSIEPVVTLAVDVNLLKALSAMLRDDALEAFTRFADLIRHDLDVGLLGMTVAGAAHRLMDHDLSIGKDESLALGAARQSGTAMDAAMPKQIVETSHFTNCMVS